MPARSPSLVSIAVAGALLAACGDDLTVQNVSPRGSVGGLVVDAATGAPMLGVSVRLVAGAQLFEPVLTDEIGYFSFDNVPAGTVIALVEAPAGYWGATVHGEILGEAGQFSVDNEALTLGPIGLLPANTVLNVRVVDERGRPVPNYTLSVSTVVEWVDLSGGGADDMGRRGFAVVTDANGAVALPPLPDFWRLGNTVNDTLVLALPPFDDDGDGANEFPGGVQTLQLRTLNDPTPDVVLDPQYSATLDVVASTLAPLEGGPAAALPALLSGGEPIFVKFNLPIDPQAVNLIVGGEDGTPISPPPTVTVTDELLEIRFNPALPVGAEFNLTLHVVASVGDRVLEADFATPFFTRNALETVTATPSNQGGVMRITFSEPVGTGNPGLNSLSGGNCVMFFNADLDGSGGLPGNFPGELGNPSCNGGHVLRAVEPDPVGPVGLSGYTRFWEFDIPGGVGSGTQLHVIFSRVSNPAFRMQRPDGRVVADFTGATLITLP